MLGLPLLLDLGLPALEARRLVAHPASVVVGPIFGRGPLVEGLARRLPAKRTTSGVLKIVDLLHQSPGKLDPFTVMFAGRSDGLAGPVGTLIATPVFRLPSAFFVHSSAGVKSLSAGQLADVYSGKVTNWKDVGGQDIRIKVVRREDADSTLQVLRQSMPGWKDLAITEKSKTAVTTQEGFNTVKEVEGAIGFGPFTRALEAELVVLKIDGRYPTDRDYPSAVTLSFVHKSATVTTDAKRFIDYVKAAKAQTVLSGMGGVPVIE